jgi:anhydro-N-acetylmuramic acid kinase
VGWNGDAMEAEGFAYLAVRSLKGLPLSLPTTTGVPQPMPGGVLYKAAK